MSTMSQLEADEAFARQLQAQELGQGSRFVQLGPIRIQERQVHGELSPPPHQEGVENNDETTNPTVLNARLNQLSSARTTVIAVLIFHVPQIVAALVILSEYWTSTAHCDQLHRNRWKWWSLINSFRMLVFTGVMCYSFVFREWLRDHQTSMNRVNNIRNIAEAAGLIWFVVGNMWIFGDNSCHHQLDSPVFNLCLAMLIISYIQICLPCLLALMLIPLFCFCLPCLIRLLASAQDSPKGATEEVIESIPTVTLNEDSDLIKGGDNTCPICLSDMVAGENVRILHCKHFFHNSCVDEWLRVNASCPTCRESILASHDEESGGSPVSTSMERETSSREEEEKRNEDNFNNTDDVESIPLVS